MKIQSANQLSGRATGALFFAGFGALWLFLALYARQQLSPASISSVALGLVLLVAAAMILFRLSKRWPRLPDDPAAGRAFAWINAIEWTAVAITAFTLSRLHLDVYVMSAITAIVGLHMFPLGRLFRYPPHYAAGGAMVIWAVASTLFLPLEQMQGVAAFGTGIILWLCATVTLAIAIPAARQSADSLTC